MDLIKRDGLYMLVGLLVCGMAGYFIAGSEGRNLGGGIGGGLGLIVGGIVARFRGKKTESEN